MASGRERDIPTIAVSRLPQLGLVMTAWAVASVVAACGHGGSSSPGSDVVAGDARDAAPLDGSADGGGDDGRLPADGGGPDAGVDAGAVDSAPRSRVVIETSAAPGEVQALGRLLFYADEVDIAGIVVTDAGAEASARIEALLSAYAATRPALQRFVDQPAVAELRSRVVVNPEGASAAMAAAVLTTAAAPSASGPSALHWLAFAPRPLALRRALDHLTVTERPDVSNARLAHLRVHGFDVEAALGPHAGALAQIQDYGPRDDADLRGGPLWTDLSTVSLAAGGPLGAHLADLAAGDSGGAPGAWLMVLPLLAGSPTVPSEPGWGGWGGRFVPAPSGLPNAFVPAPNDTFQDLRGTIASVARFASAAILDARARILRPSVSRINHAPVPEITVVDAAGRVLAPLPRDVNAPSTTIYEIAAGAVFTLDAAASRDPDGDGLTIRWSLYPEAGRFPGEVTLRDPLSPTATIELPIRLAEQQSVHVLCQVTDMGSAPLIRHHRLVFVRRR